MASNIVNFVRVQLLNIAMPKAIKSMQFGINCTATSRTIYTGYVISIGNHTHLSPIQE